MYQLAALLPADGSVDEHAPDSTRVRRALQEGWLEDWGALPLIDEVWSATVDECEEEQELFDAGCAVRSKDSQATFGVREKLQVCRRRNKYFSPA